MRLEEKMGCYENITADTFPKQGHVGSYVTVCFHYDASREFRGKIMRDDIEDPFVMVIQLEDGRVVLGSECQHT